MSADRCILDRDLVTAAIDALMEVGIEAPALALHAALAAAPAAPAAEPVGWRDHVEPRLRQWRQSFVNRSGDQLALDDFMDAKSLDDLIDYVCDEWSGPPAAPGAAPAQSREPLTAFTKPQVRRLWINSPEIHADAASYAAFARIVGLCERAHGIGSQP